MASSDSSCDEQLRSRSDSGSGSLYSAPSTEGLRSRSNSLCSIESTSSSLSECRNFISIMLPYMECQNFSTLLMGKTPTKGRSVNLGGPADVTTDSTMYLDYPPTKPFINDDYERPPYKPVSSYPEGNRKAVVSALKNLQGKIHQLELERTAAEDNLKSLASETNKYRDILQKDNERIKPSQTVVSKHNQELECQLSAAETRCDLLEKQLDYMKNMVHTSERDRKNNAKKHVEIETPPEPVDRSSGFRENLRKIAELERDHIKLTANQSLAEGKIRELEERLGDERHHRQRMVEKTAEIESVQNAQRIYDDTPTESLDPDIDNYRLAPDNYRLAPKPKRTVKKKKKAVVSKKCGAHPSQKHDPSKHYRLNLADIPFVAGKNTGPSYSVGANVQRVFSMMKNHNMALCSRATHPVSGPCGSRQSSSGSSSPTTEADLADILLQLQDEFHQMSFEHQELSKEINETSDLRIREDLERELDALVSRMEAKSQQIAKIRKHQEKAASKKKKKKSKKIDPEFEDDLPPRPKSAQHSYHSSRSPRVAPSPRYNGEVEVTTTIKSKGMGHGVVQIRPSSARDISLNVLKDMRKLQTTLRKDDLSWK